MRIETERHLGTDGVFHFRKLVAVVHGIVTDHVVQTVALRITPGENTAARRRAGGPAHVEIGQAHSAGGELVEIRRGRIFPCPWQPRSTSQIVGHDQQDVRPGLLFARIGRPNVAAGSGEAQHHNNECSNSMQ